MDQLSSTEYIGGLYRKSTVNKLPLMGGGGEIMTIKRGNQVQFFAT